MTEETGWPDPSPDLNAKHKEFCLYVGGVIRIWVEIEFLLLFCFAALLKIDQYKARILWERLGSFKNRRDTIQILTRTYLDDPERGEFLGVLERAGKFSERRNKLAHVSGGPIPESPNKILFFKDTFSDNAMGWNFRHWETELGSLASWPKDFVAFRATLDPWPDRIHSAVSNAPRRHWPDPSVDGE